MHPSSQAAVMNFLNEIASDFPSAISLAAGRPCEKFFERLSPEALLNSWHRYEHHFAHGTDLANARAQLLQYGRTAGIINDLVAQHLRIDAGVPASGDRLLITTGCQEALALCLPTLCPNFTDVLLVCNPTYIGATGAAYTSRVTISALPTDVDLASGIERSVAQLRRNGQQARALYLIPDFDNPTGRVLDESQRRAVLAVCIRERIVILEDNPYGAFRYEGQAIQPMAALDNAGCVIYLSTFSKTLSPALRIGSATLPDTLFGNRAARQTLWRALVQRKSFVTVNTSSIAQAMVGGILLDQECSLQRWIQPVVDLYRSNRDTMLNQLETIFSPLADQIRWNRPSGGFFLSIDLPFSFDARAVTECAANYGVAVMPMSFFALDKSQDQRIRLSFSAVDQQQINTSVAALGRYVAQQIGRNQRPSTEVAAGF
jgi:(S)-3,5-dihydroxyphenylglycine transaminase